MCRTLTTPDPADEIARIALGNIGAMRLMIDALSSIAALPCSPAASQIAVTALKDVKAEVAPLAQVAVPVFAPGPGRDAEAGW